MSFSRLTSVKKEANYVRKSDFLACWPEWKQVVKQYYSPWVSYLMQELHHVHRTSTSLMYKCLNDTFVHHTIKNLYESRLQWEGSFETKVLEVIHNGRIVDPGCNPFARRDLHCSCTLNYFMDSWCTGLQFPFDGCENQKHHIHSFLLSVLLYKISITDDKAINRYLWELGRLILALPLDRLMQNNFESILDMIFRPGKYVTYFPGLLRNVYDRLIFDIFSGKTFKNIIYWAEQSKHDIATCQSGSGTMFDEIVKLADQVECQGFGSLYMNHTLKIDDEAFAKFETAVINTQNNFSVMLRNAAMEAVTDITVLFICVATMALLGYSLVKFGTRLIMKCLNLLYKVVCGKLFDSDKDLIVCQSGDEISIPLLPSIIVNKVIAPPAEILKNVWNNPQTDRIMRRIGYFGDPKISRGMDKISEWVHKVIQDTIAWFSKEFLGIEVAEDISHTCSPVEQWYVDCDVFIERYYADQMLWNDINWSVLMNLYGRGMALTRQSVFNEFKNDIWKIIFKLGNILEKFNTHGRSGTSIRNPPVTIYMAGGTGVGKSSITYPLAAEVLSGIFTKEQSSVDLEKYWKNLIYMRSAEQEFWDGYENQLVTVFDDFGQLVDSTSSPNTELFEVIRASNSFPYPLHMASIDQKATTTFNSKIILVSSNLTEPKTASLNFPQALQRRFDLSVIVTRKPGVKVVPGEFNPDIYEFQRYDMVNKTLGEYMSYKDVIFFAVTEYFKRKGFVDSMDNYITKTIREAKAQGLGSYLGEGAATVVSSVTNVKDRLIKFGQEVKQSFNTESPVYLLRELKKGIELAKLKLSRLSIFWTEFKKNHPYLIKALKFVGILTMVIGVIRLFYSLTGETDKTKIMSAKQFVKGTPEVPSVEGYNPSNVALVKHEGYNAANVTTAKVESYSAVNVTLAKAEGLLFEIVCPCEFTARWRANPMKKFFLKECDHTNIAEAEGVKDTNASEIMLKVLRHNMYKLYIADDRIPIGHGFFLRGRIFMCPQHYLHVLRKVAALGGNIYFRNMFLNRAFEVPAKEIIDSSVGYESPDPINGPVISRDIMSFPVRTANFHGNMLTYFASKSSLHYVRHSDIVMPLLLENDDGRSDRPVVGFKFATGRSCLVRKEKLDVTIDSVKVHYMRDLWEYNIDTRESECGAPLIVRNTQIAPGKIVGIHVAGTNGDRAVGFASPVYIEDVERILKQHSEFDTTEFKMSLPVMEAEAQGSIPEDCEFIRFGVLEQSIAQPSKSKIIPSPINGKITQCKTRPCLLRETLIDGETFNPRTFRIRKLGGVPKYISQDLLRFARKAVVDEMSTQINRISFGDEIKSVYTFEEAVAGIDGEEYINAIKRNTSPGYPFVHLKGFQNRKAIFGDEEKCDMTRSQAQIIQKRVEQIIDGCKKGIVREHVFMDTLKDERKPIGKSHKTRLFSAGPLDYLIACKQYFNGVVALIQKARNTSHVSVGTNVYSYDWTVIANELRSKSEHMIAGDFEGFDASQTSQMLEMAIDILIELSARFCGSSQEEQLIMRRLMISLLFSTHVNGRDCYQWTHSLPSGHYLTAIINSIFVLLAFVLVWMISQEQGGKQKPSVISARSFFKNCGIVAYGDDHVVSVPESELELFNQKCMPHLMQNIGLSYTMEEKDQKAEMLSRTIYEVSFLKRKFAFCAERQRWLSPICLDTITEMPMWLHKCADEVSQTIVQLEQALKELSLHGSSVWREWFPRFERCFQLLGHFTEFTEQEEVRSLVLD